MVDALVASERHGFGLALIQARRNIAIARIGDVLGVPLPVGPTWASNDDLVLMGTSPRTWLAQAGNVSAGWSDGVRARLAGLASVSDQSSGYRLLRLAGGGVRPLLQSGLLVDLHPSRFPARAIAVSAIAHIGVVVRQLDGESGYEVAIPTSYWESFVDWLAAQGAARSAPLDRAALCREAR